MGRLKHIETTLIVLPKKIIEAIKGRGQDLEYNFTDVTRQVGGQRSWKPKDILKQLKPNNLILSLLFFPLVIVVIIINLVKSNTDTSVPSLQQLPEASRKKGNPGIPGSRFIWTDQFNVSSLEFLVLISTFSSTASLLAAPECKSSCQINSRRLRF